MRYFWIIVLLHLGPLVHGQLRFKNIDQQRIQDKKVEKLIDKNSEESLTSAPSCYDDQDSNQYRKHVAEFVIEDDVESVWYRYIHSSSKEAWNNRIMKLKFLFSNQSQKMVYSDETYLGIEQGQMILLRLKLVGGLVKLGVGFEITDVNDESHEITYCYMKNGKSQGTQRINMTTLPNGKTLLTHTTYYKSDSKFRDRNLYPYYHMKAITAFHSGINKTLAKVKR